MTVKINSLELKTEEKIKHVEKCLRYLSVRKVLAQETTFVKQTENFYGIDVFRGSGRSFPDYQELRADFDRREEDLPSDLLDIFSIFHDAEFDKERLVRNKVREDYSRWHGLRWKSKMGFSFISGVLGGAALIGSVIADFYLNYHLSESLILSGAPIAIWGEKNLLEANPKGTDYSFREFFSLYHCAEDADEFMNNEFKKYFITTHLNS